MYLNSAILLIPMANLRVFPQKNSQKKCVFWDNCHIIWNFPLI
jgi:hypothetical protein